MSVPVGFIRVSRSNPCRVCGKKDWCLVAQDGSVAICARVESKRQCGEAGWKHELVAADGQPAKLPEWSAARRAELARARDEARQAELRARADLDFPALARRFAAAMTAPLLEELAEALDLPAGVLREMQAGVARGYRMPRRPPDRPVTIDAWSFPMRNGAGEIVGITFRTAGGDKFRHTYSDNAALFVPDGIKPVMGAAGMLFSPEGPTSNGALRALGLRSVGRPNNRMGAAHLAEYCRRLRPSRLILVGDNDRKFNESLARFQWPGLEGAERLAEELAARGIPCPVSIVLPPDGVKDVRVWRSLGAGRADVLERSRMTRLGAGGVCA